MYTIYASVYHDLAICHLGKADLYSWSGLGEKDIELMQDARSYACLLRSDIGQLGLGRGQGREK